MDAYVSNMRLEIRIIESHLHLNTIIIPTYYNTQLSLHVSWSQANYEAYKSCLAMEHFQGSKNTLEI